MNPLVWLESILSFIIETIFGLPLRFETVTAIVVVFGLGFLIGKLTKNFSFFSMIGILILGAFAYDLLKVAQPAFVWLFILGVLVNHGALWYRSVRWARSIGDFIFATRYRKAFEDIRRREAELADLERKLREQYRAQSKTQSESGTQQQWREQAKARKGGSGGTSGSSSGSTGGSGYSANNNSARDEYLRTMGLSPQSQFSADDLKRAYRKRARETHPDLGGSTSEFQRVSGAYEWLLKNQ